MKINIKEVLTMSMVLSVTVLFAQTAGAQTVSDVAERLTDQLTNISKLAVGVMFVGGLVTGGMSALKFKEHNENPNQTKLSKPITYLLVSAALIGIPTYLGTMTNTLNGEGHKSSDATGSTFNQIR
ncbi:hypothetical protein H4F33_13945 [Pectobacterium brasiliense]|uniref:hypothetical protein n=1 Tax=Pectobacterium brasiliense TaxID=180957 RepID=UPI0015E031A9|nr:hypothetical protein [Pectobacterium brasiliense]MBA0218806.1 hypothetical protein [Pectobacterium brasiliense]MBN3073184.1 hypothetical protein [Pectobacterium brasiliense]MBN3170605.1 hypothetical protein [Pectobacterium brasiliense]